MYVTLKIKQDRILILFFFSFCTCLDKFVSRLDGKTFLKGFDDDGDGLNQIKLNYSVD